jgi:hypothetical protein
MILKNGAIVIGFFEKISSQRWAIRSRWGRQGVHRQLQLQGAYELSGKN